MNVLSSLRLLLAVGLVFGGFLPVLKAVEPPEVELIADEVLQPSSTLEVRFAREMVAREALGVPAKSPLQIEPALPGKFTWLSSRSGVYAPSEMPPLGREFTVKVRPGLTDAAKKPIGEDFSATLKTPPFGVTVTQGIGTPDVVAAEPTLRIAFNLAVEIDPAQFQFVNDRGDIVPAEVRYATSDDYFRLNAGDDDWVERWERAHGAVAGPGESEESEEEGPKRTYRNRLIITPASPLTPGGLWSFEMKKGVVSSRGGYVTSEAMNAPLGRVRPFVIREMRVTSYLNSGRSVALDFSDPIAPDVTSETAAKFFEVTPAVPNLRFEEGWSSIVIRGDFERGREYTLRIAPSLVSRAGLPLDSERERKFTFEPVKPRLYLPEITAHQILGGRRKLDAVSVNLRSLRVVARLVEPEKTPQAVEAFEQYHKPYTPDGDPDEVYQPIPEGLISGTVIYDETMAIPDATLDARQVHALDWNKILGEQKAGAIFLTVEGEPLPELQARRPAAQALIQLTDLGILWKTPEGKLDLDVFSMATGNPVAGAEVQLLDKAFGASDSGQTNESGHLTLDPGSDPGWLLVRAGNDAHALRMGPSAVELPMASFRLPVWYAGWGEDARETPLRALIFTDRPLYRPGEMVRVKGIVRRVEASGLKPLAGAEGSLELTLPNDRGTVDVDIKTNERGAFDANVQLEGSVTGEYSLQLKFPRREQYSWQKGFRCEFQVAEFQPNAFEVDLATPNRFQPEAKVSADVSARYFFGAPVKGGQVQWTLQYRPSRFAPEGFADFVFGDPSEQEQKSLTLRGEAKLDEKLTIEPELPEVSNDPATGVFTVEVTDRNQQTVSASRSFTRDAAEFYVGLEVPAQTFIGHDEGIVARAVAVRANGEPMPEPVDVRVELIRVDYETVRVQGAGKAISFRSETTEKTVDLVEGRTLIPEHNGTSWKLPEGVTAKFKPGKAGQYRLKVTAQDKAGRRTFGTLAFAVSGQEAIAWGYRHPAQLELVPDKAEYRPGDTAEILVKTPIAGEAVVTVERGDRILRRQKVRLSGNAPTFSLPLRANDSPNVFVSLMLIRGAEESTRKYKVPEYRYGLCQLNVSTPSRLLKVDISTDRPVAQPGEELESTIEIHDGTGARVPDAEVTFYAVDDGILAITGYERPAPDDIFSAPFPLQIRTGLSLFELMPEDPADLEYGNKGYLIGGGGIEGPAPKLRHDFPGTAFWFPTLITDKDGKARVRFRVPDALTRYRLVAVAHAQGNRFGSGESAFTIRKPLMLLSALGQTAHIGDEILARAVIRNETGKDGAAEVTLNLDDTAEPATSGALSKTIEVKNGESQAVDFPVRIRAAGEAAWTWSAKMGSGVDVEEDNVAATLRIGSPVPLLRETYLSDLREKNNDVLAGVNPQVLEGTGGVALTVSNTRLATLRQSATDLLQYPYGCAEQTVSSLLPWIVRADLREVLPDLEKSEEEVRKTIHEGLDKIFALQTGGGGLMFWPTGNRAQLFPSAWAAVALAALNDQGVELPAGWGELLEYLSGQLRGIANARPGELDECALALYALSTAGVPEPAYNEQLYRRRKELTRESRALLALAVAEAGGAKDVVSELLNPKTPAPDEYSWFGSATRERAIRLMAWIRFKPRDNEVDRLVKELLQSRVNGAWRTTQENAWALLALSRYFKTIEREIKPVGGTVVKAEENIPFQLTKEELTRTVNFAFSPESPLGSLAVQNPKKGNLYGEVRFVVQPPVAEQPRQDRGYSVSRSYRKIASDGSLQDASDLKVGDRVLVTLRIETSKPGHFVAVDDPLPAILEAVNPDFKARAVGGAEGLDRSWAADYREIRADRVLYFCDHLPAGAFTFTYLARVRTAGRVIAPAVKVEEMYRPERFGLSETARLESRPVDL